MRTDSYTPIKATGWFPILSRTSPPAHRSLREFWLCWELYVADDAAMSVLYGGVFNEAAMSMLYRDVFDEAMISLLRQW